MPSHNHNVEYWPSRGTQGGLVNGAFPNGAFKNTGSTGGSNAHNVIQPYHALIYCVKQPGGAVGGNDSDWNVSGSNMYPFDLSYNVGIGTTSPTHKLNVVGDANVTGTVYAKNFSGNSDITFINGTGSAIMTIKDSGNVGIGTTSPSAKLHIQNGSILIKESDGNI